MDFDIDKELEEGPLVKRKCTDPICCLAFVAFIGFSIYLMDQAIKKGQPDKFLRPVDADGKQ